MVRRKVSHQAVQGEDGYDVSGCGQVTADQCGRTTCFPWKSWISFAIGLMPVGSVIPACGFYDPQGKQVVKKQFVFSQEDTRLTQETADSDHYPTRFYCHKIRAWRTPKGIEPPILLSSRGCRGQKGHRTCLRLPRESMKT